MHKTRKEILYLFILIVFPVTFLFSFVFISNLNTEQQIASSSNSIFTDDFSENRELIKKEIFFDTKILASSAVVKDLNTGEIIFAKNENLVLPLASITKVLTALTAEMTSTKEIYQVTAEDLKQEGDHFLSIGEKFKKNDLINFMLLTSSNDAAATLSANSFGDYQSPSNNFIEKMNDIAKNIGMKNSYFLNPTGLDRSPNIAGAHGSAMDVVALFEYILKNHPHILENTKNPSMRIVSESGIIHNIRNTNQNVGMLPNTLASKTGFTDLAGGNLAVVFDPALNRPIVIVVLGSTEPGRFLDVKKLTEKTIEYLKI
ncbi:MAG TPA: serine hydrolase [Candidatus Paceibacterota bacterium]|nr:serine hydrolase [Candidatus Paceibacterota bacterium]HMP18739.1 serine hydrolase [Candidatus Paceibacterota bacterium]HMP85254.1 serine hydrolase [Candidatus Paceibacterota bacterium]